MKNELITLMAIAITASPFTFAEAQSYKGGKQGDGAMASTDYPGVIFLHAERC